jgi:ribose/xylose/arabinose/galactoside ABC-type transport system permease subunit
LCAAFGALAGFAVPGFLSAANLANVAASVLPLFILALGQTLVLIGGCIDLSVTAVVALASVTGALVMTEPGGLGTGPGTIAAALLAMLLGGILVGAANGLSVARLRMPPFLATLAMLTFVSGFAIWLTASRGIVGLPRGFLSVFGPGLGPGSLALSVSLALATHWLLTRTLYGRWLLAVGGNVRAARVSGVPVERVVIASFAASGLCAAASSILYTARLETGSPVMGQRLFLDVIGAVVIGGASLFGGRGSVAGAFLGALFLTLLDTSLTLQGLSSFAVLMVKGTVILAAASLDAWRVRAASTR